MELETSTSQQLDGCIWPGTLRVGAAFANFTTCPTTLAGMASAPDAGYPHPVQNFTMQFAEDISENHHG